MVGLGTWVLGLWRVLFIRFSLFVVIVVAIIVITTASTTTATTSIFFNCHFLLF